MPIFGAKSRAARGCASKLACGRRIVQAEQADFMEVCGRFETFLGPMCTGKRQTHIRNAPSSRTAVTGIDPYTETGSACVCAAAFRKIRCTLPGGQSRPPIRSRTISIVIGLF